MPNRLARETSPYLQQHAANPVDWFPWGEEALARARREDKPILLSVGYSACHWCHVMARESFEDAAVARVMNRLFVNIKVDREERPDLDQIYQAAHQMLARRAGGWPLTMFLSPDGAPFFGGTYFPREPRYGLPGFGELCERVAALWSEQRTEIAAQNAEILRALAQTAPQRVDAHAALSRAAVDAVLGHLRGSFDARFGGFGGAPKFPHPADLELCLRHGETGIALGTLARMCEGGIYDQLAGGFCRYSTDAQWSIPHFEKMLYDNGALLALLADAALLDTDGGGPYARCAADTAGWLMREMQSPEGGYYSSLDADSEHEEGRYYVWDREDVRSLLDAREFEVVSSYYGLDAAPNFENRHWHLRVSRPLLPEEAPIVETARAKLLAAREKRVRPARDEKVLVSWNALAVRGMARAARVFGRPEWSRSARRALEFIRSALWRDGRLLATYKDGRAHLNAYLDDYAFLLAALLETMQQQFLREDLAWARSLADALLEQFEDPALGGFFFTGRDHEQLIHRPKPGHDNATPSGNAVAAWALGRLAALTGEARYARAAERTVQLFQPLMLRHAGGFGAMAIALAEAITPPRLLVLKGEEPALPAWQAALAREYLADTMVLAIADGGTGLPAVLDKPRGAAPVNAWLCRGVTCLPPIDDLVNLKQALKENS
jgi:uncharacterized protein YyaL (SSP411 family)